MIIYIHLVIVATHGGRFVDTAELAYGLLAGWARGERVLAFVLCEQGSSTRYKVRGLDDQGLPEDPNMFMRAVEALTDDGVAGEWTAVRGDHPQCSAVRFFRTVCAGGDAFIVITPSRLAVAVLRDKQSGTEGALNEIAAEKSVGGLLRGVGKLVKSAASSIRRPPLTERPQDASLTVDFEGPRHELAGIQRWKQPMVPDLEHGPRLVQIHFADGSWTRVQTTFAGAETLTGAP